jgi:copper chaperone CopZ
MNSLKKIMMAVLVLLSGVSNAQIKNAKTETVKIFGNCGMCKTKIEKAGNLKNIAQVDWNEDTKMATLTYDESKTNQDEILKRIALVGYDSEKFLAPDKAYSNLPGCCQYDREAKVPVKVDAVSGATKMVMNDNTTMSENQESNQLQSVFDNYLYLLETTEIDSGANGYFQTTPPKTTMQLIFSNLD